jgi:hypothetical protein
MSPQKTVALLAGYGFREESISLFGKIARDGIARLPQPNRSSRRSHRSSRTDTYRISFGGSAGSANTAAAAHSRSTALFLSLPKFDNQTPFPTLAVFVGSNPEQWQIPIAFSLGSLRKWHFYPDGALAPEKGSYFVLPDVTAGKMVVPPNVIEVLCEDLLWRSFFWNACLRARLQRANLPIDIGRLKSL